MKYISTFLFFWYDFVIGDDWRNAAATLIAIGLTVTALSAGIAAFWIFPIVIGLYLVTLLKTT